MKCQYCVHSCNPQILFKVQLSYLKMTISIVVASLNSLWGNIEICLIHIVLHFILLWHNNHHFEANTV